MSGAAAGVGRQAGRVITGNGFSSGANGCPFAWPAERKTAAALERPAPAQRRAKAERRRAAVWAGVDEDVDRAVMAAVVGKAAAGDLKAAELLLKVIGPGKAG